MPLVKTAEVMARLSALDLRIAGLELLCSNLPSVRAPMDIDLNTMCSTANVSVSTPIDLNTMCGETAAVISSRDQCGGLLAELDGTLSRLDGIVKVILASGPGDALTDVVGADVADLQESLLHRVNRLDQPGGEVAQLNVK